MVDTPALEAGGRKARVSSSLTFGTINSYTRKKLGSIPGHLVAGSPALVYGPWLCSSGGTGRRRGFKSLWSVSSVLVRVQPRVPNGRLTSEELGHPAKMSAVKAVCFEYTAFRQIIWKGRIEAECTSLENWRARKGPVGSNPTPSAKNFQEKLGSCGKPLYVVGGEMVITPSCGLGVGGSIPLLHPKYSGVAKW